MKLYIKAKVEDIFPASNPKTSPEMLREFAKSPRLSDIRMVAYNPSTPSDVLSELIQSKDDIVRSGIYHNPNTPKDIKKRLYDYFYSKGRDTMRAYHIAPMVANTQIYDKKIYASQDDVIDLDWFVGKDLWVLVRLDSYRFNPYPMYVKIIRENAYSSDGTSANIIHGYDCKLISPDMIAREIYDANGFKEYLKDRTRCLFIEEGEISLVEPLDYMSTDDLVYELFGEDF